MELRGRDEGVRQVSIGEGSWSYIQRTFSLEEKLRLLSDLMVIMEGGAKRLQECITGSEGLWLTSIQSKAVLSKCPDQSCSDQGQINQFDIDFEIEEFGTSSINMEATGLKRSQDCAEEAFDQSRPLFDSSTEGYLPIATTSPRGGQRCTYDKSSVVVKDFALAKVNS
jgi:hypothetical protein